MRLANAPYYGLARRVSSASRAVVLLGFSTVRALSVGAACGLLSEQERKGPHGYWLHSVTTAVAASVVARQGGYPPADAFSAGLLHDIGTALLHRAEPALAATAAAAAGDTGAELLDAELATLGTTHAAAGAEVLESWRFPAPFVRAVARHHDAPHLVPDTLTRLVIAGEALAVDVDGGGSREPHVSADEALDCLGIASNRVPRLLQGVQVELRSLAAFLGV
jgi:putative nucleotidyltransferase with HDIG domain